MPIKTQTRTFFTASDGSEHPTMRAAEVHEFFLIVGEALHKFGLKNLDAIALALQKDGRLLLNGGGKWIENDGLTRQPDGEKYVEAELRDGQRATARVNTFDFTCIGRPFDIIRYRIID